MERCSSMFLLTPRGKDMWKFPRPVSAQNPMESMLQLCSPPPTKKKTCPLRSCPKKPREPLGRCWGCSHWKRHVVCSERIRFLVFCGKFAPQKLAVEMKQKWRGKKVTDGMELSEKIFNSTDFFFLSGSKNFTMTTSNPAVLRFWTFKKSSVPCFFSEAT